MLTTAAFVAIMLCRRADRPVPLPCRHRLHLGLGQSAAVPVLSAADVRRGRQLRPHRHPLFILIGEIMNGGGITRHRRPRHGLIGSVRGGPRLCEHPRQHVRLLHPRSATAQVAIMAQIMVPEMESRATTRPSPPASRPMAACWADHPALGDVRRLFGAGAGLGVGHAHRRILPGILLTACFLHLYRHHGVKYNYPRAPKQTLRERSPPSCGRPDLAIPLVIVGSILSALANATESAAVGTVAAALVVRFWTKEFSSPASPR